MRKTIIIPIFILILALIGYGIYTSLDSNEDIDIAEQIKEKESTNVDDTTTEEKVNIYMDITAKEAKELIDSTEDLIILDVSNRYDEGHIPGAINYYVGDGSLDKAIPSLDKNVPYLVYCHVDSAAILGAQKLIDAGFEKVYRLEGNYSAWVDAGYDIEK